MKDGELGVERKLDDGGERVMKGFLLLWALFPAYLTLVFLESATA